MNRRQQLTLIGSLAILSAAAGFLSGRGIAAGAADPLQLAPSIESGVGIFASRGEPPEIMRREEALNVSAY